MRIVIAPDSFKGSVSAVQAANAMEKGILKVFPQADIVKIPIADGGEGTVEALVEAAGGKILYHSVLDPLGRRIRAAWGVIDNGHTAVIEMAAASGLTLIEPEKRDPRITSTYGTGQLIKAALDEGVEKIILGIGGSGTNDGGAGMARALGVRFLDEQGNILPDGGSSLARLASIDMGGLDPRVQTCEMLVACDVDNPLCGPRGATRVFGPQKGADPQMVEELDTALYRYAIVAERVTQQDMADYPGAGAAGGLGAGLLFFTKAKLLPGVDIVLESTGFAARIKSANLVITGEGCTDFQTAYGKAPVGVAKIAREFGVPVICLSGCLGREAEKVLDLGIDALMSVAARPMSLKESMDNGEKLIEEAAERLCRLLKTGFSMVK